MSFSLYQSKYPISANCPRCGEVAHRRVPSETALALLADRVCGNCGTRYTPPTRAWGRALIALVGLGLMAAGVGSAFWMLWGDPPDVGKFITLLIGGVAVGVVFFYKAFLSERGTSPAQIPSGQRMVDQGTREQGTLDMLSGSENLFGIVDRVPGQFYIATRFLHLNGFPLVPFRSYLVLEASVVEPTKLRQGTFSGWPIGWNWRSIFKAWFQGWVVLLAVVAFVTALMALLGHFNGASSGPLALQVGVAAAAACAGLIGIYILTGKGAAASRQRLDGLRQRLAAKYPDAARAVAAYLEQQPETE